MPSFQGSAPRITWTTETLASTLRGLPDDLCSLVGARIRAQQIGHGFDADVRRKVARALLESALIFLESDPPHAPPMREEFVRALLARRNALEVLDGR